MKRWQRLLWTRDVGRPAAVRVLWDVDNKHIQSVQSGLPACFSDNRCHSGLDAHANLHAARAIVRAASTRGSVTSLDAFANEATWGQPEVHAAVNAAGFCMHRLPNSPQAADRAICAAIRQWLESASRFRARLKLVLVSDDRGFEGILRAASAHARIVTISNTRWSAYADERLPWAHMLPALPEVWWRSEWHRELQMNGGRERQDSLYMSQDGHQPPGVEMLLEPDTPGRCGYRGFRATRTHPEEWSTDARWDVLDGVPDGAWVGWKN